ncbi:pyruvate carboxylase [Egicoccus halophilus]|uniref:Pyruvate carboxylase n=1 Tax=Egicoccus halophilus TaxID=1670830 RepID=A0A8J3EW24_9ACTN|nr:pyruvate carboxylase [Egicoccus halophilus]GGI02472.1 pyruvate carboxylase [Egicoccus halophilus]
MDKLLVANRGEIAVRIMRAANELDIRTVAVYSHEDRSSLHRLKADESYAIGDAGHPVRSYLDIEAIVGLAERVGADALHPGYGFLSESADLAEACARAGVTFVGPTPATLRLTGDKTRARDSAAAAGLPVLRASAPVAGGSDAVDAAADLGYPVFVKAAAGGGGRGLRRVTDPGELVSAVETAIREAEGAFGDPTVFLEQAMIRPRHIEVQILGDAAGNIIHLFERDCSVQRRHQKVIEVAPAPALAAELRERLWQDAVTFGRATSYENAGTVEFLVDEAGDHRFIEMNPRIQVEHTVTEEVTDVDLVQTQLRLADGASLPELGLEQEAVRCRGTAIQCRITTEDPANDFRPDLGRVSAVRDVGGAGIRVDSASVEVGMEVTPYFDPLLVKLTARGPDLASAARRARRAVTEFRVRGVRSNTAFLAAVLSEPDFLEGRATTAFIDEHPALVRTAASGDRTSRLLEFLGWVTVNHPNGARPAGVTDPVPKLPVVTSRGTDAGPAEDAGSRVLLDRLGPDAFAAHLRERQSLAVTDTTYRDAHQSLLATRVRTFDLVTAARVQAGLLPGLFSHEVWGGATYDVALRFLHEDPWERLRQLRQASPDICLQMLLRGQNTVGYGTYPTPVVEAFVDEAVASGIDIFRVFDALNDADRMAPAIAAVVAAGRVAEGTLCYTGDMLDPAETTYDLDHYLGVADKLTVAGAQVLCVKDMAGLLRPPAAQVLVEALRERFAAPVHLHTHDTAGGQLATYLAAIDAGVDAVDGAIASMAGGTSQPSLAGIVAATDHTRRATGLDLATVGALEPYWEAVRALYAPFEAGLVAPTGRVYTHEIPGGQLSNLRQQAAAMGLADRFEEIEELYARCSRLLGRPIKVTPTSKVVGDLALYLASANIDPDLLQDQPERFDLPESVLNYLRGDLGEPPGGWPEPFRSRVLDAHGRSVTGQQPDADVLRKVKAGSERQSALSHLLFPGPATEYVRHLEAYGDVSVLPTAAFLYGLEVGEEVGVDLGAGVRLYVELEAVTSADERGIRTVVLRVNGQTRFVEVLDEAVGGQRPSVVRADPSDASQVAAPVTGVVTVDVGEGDRVDRGQRLATIEAMKMESAVGAQITGTVVTLAASSGDHVEAGDLLMILGPTDDG